MGNEDSFPVTRSESAGGPSNDTWTFIDGLPQNQPFNQEFFGNVARPPDRSKQAEIVNSAFQASIARGNSFQLQQYQQQLMNLEFHSNVARQNQRVERPSQVQHINNPPHGTLARTDQHAMGDGNASQFQPATVSLHGNIAGSDQLARRRAAMMNAPLSNVPFYGSISGIPGVVGPQQPQPMPQMSTSNVSFFGNLDRTDQGAPRNNYQTVQPYPALAMSGTSAPLSHRPNVAFYGDVSRMNSPSGQPAHPPQSSIPFNAYSQQQVQNAGFHSGVAQTNASPTQPVPPPEPRDPVDGLYGQQQVQNLTFHGGVARMKGPTAPSAQPPKSNHAFDGLYGQQQVQNVAFHGDIARPNGPPGQFPQALQNDNPIYGGGDLLKQQQSHTQRPYYVSLHDVSLHSANQHSSGYFQSEVSSNRLPYQPLDHVSRQIRLVKIDPSDGPDGSRCAISTFSLDEAKHLHYESLSYCWGDASDTRTIQVRFEPSPGPVQYHPFSIRANLAEALESLRRTHAGNPFWIDAICINQQNVQERGAQVAMMREIYSKAKGVTVWLGGGSIALDQSLDVMVAISEKFEKDTSLNPSSIAGPDGISLDQQYLKILEGYKHNGFGSTTRQAYAKVQLFFALPWFRRVWVLQEVFMNNAVTVRIGSRSLPWGTTILASLWQSFLSRDYTLSGEHDSQHVEDPSSGSHHQGFLPELWHSVLHARHGNGVGVLDLVLRARDFNASDQRDKVFALLGLANDLGDPKSRPHGLQPDYEKDKITVYCDFAAHLMYNKKNLDILSGVDTFTDARTAEPSWMPNFDHSIATIRGFGYPRKYNASNSTSAVIYHNPDMRMLTIEGFTVDAIKILTPGILTLTKGLEIRLDGQPNGLQTIWNNYVTQYPVKTATGSLLKSFVHTFAAAGFALPADSLEHPFGNVVAPQKVPNILSDFAAYWSRTEPSFTSLPAANRSELNQRKPHGDAEQFAVLAGKACHERKFFVSWDGYMGLCPRGARQGDIIVALDGGSVPYVLRRGTQSTYSFVGECYVDGIMFGEAVLKKGNQGIPTMAYSLV